MARALVIAPILVLLATVSCSSGSGDGGNPSPTDTTPGAASPTAVATRDLKATCAGADMVAYPPDRPDHPVIDRLSDGASYDDLLDEFIADNCMRMNHVQVLGTHNSYHITPSPKLLEAIRGFDPEEAVHMEYSHKALSEQLTAMGVRQLELDVYADPEGGLFSNPVGPQLIGEPDPQEGLGEPGLKVLHSQDLDYRTGCGTFIACLEEIRAWSDANPGHLPLLVMVEAKDTPLPPVDLPLEWTLPVPFDAAQLAKIDEEIRSVFEPGRLITPDDVRGTRATLNEAILKDGWPTLREARGRVFFALDNEGQHRTDYLAGHPSLQGRVMFTSSPAGQPESAFIKMNAPLADGALPEIQRLVKAGYLVRTRADENTLEAREGLTQRRDAAFESGAQFISTDYPVADIRWPSYHVTMPDGSPGQCNPVFAPAGCSTAGLEPTY